MTEKKRVLSDDEKNNMSQGRLQESKKKPSKKLTTKNVSTTLSSVKDTKKIEDFLVKNIMKTHYESEDEKHPVTARLYKLNIYNKIKLN